jgi:hypothetical protein
MTGIARATTVVSLVLVGLLAFAATTVAFDARGLLGAQIGANDRSGSTGLPSAGSYDNLSINASVSVYGDTSQISVSVTDMMNQANPVGEPSKTTHEVDVFLQACDFGSGICGAGCFIPDGAGDFTFSSDLSSATLNTTVTASTAACQDNPISGLPTPFTLNVMWTATASSGSSKTLGFYSCANYTNETTTIQASAVSPTATIATSLLASPIGPVDANLYSFEQIIHVQGTPLDGCTPLGGKGAGPGPQAPGDYTFASRSASFTVTPDDTSQAPVSIFVTSFVNTSRPKGGSPSTLAETDLNIFQFSPFNIVRNCYVIPASAFTLASDLSSATIHVSITPSTPPCPQATNGGFPDTFSLDATLTQVGPVSSLRTLATGGCGTFHRSTLSNESTTDALATGAMPGIAESFAAIPANMGTNTQTIHIEGGSTGC